MSEKSHTDIEVVYEAKTEGFSLEDDQGVLKHLSNNEPILSHNQCWYIACLFALDHQRRRWLCPQLVAQKTPLSQLIHLESASPQPHD